MAIHVPDSVCSCCSGAGTQLKMDAYGDHSFACSHRGCRIRRHDALKLALGEAATGAGLGPVIEQRTGEPGEGGQRPADIYRGSFFFYRGSFFFYTKNYVKTKSYRCAYMGRPPSVVRQMRGTKRNAVKGAGLFCSRSGELWQLVC